MVMVGKVVYVLYKENQFKEWFERIPPPFSCKGEIIIGYDEINNTYTHVEKNRLDLSTLRGVEGVFRDTHHKKLIYLCYGMGINSLREYGEFKLLFWERIFDNSPGVEILYTGTYQFTLNKRYYNRFKVIIESLEKGSVEINSEIASEEE